MSDVLAVRPAEGKTFKKKIYFFWIGVSLLTKIWQTHSSAQISESIDSMRGDWTKLGGVFRKKTEGEMIVDVIQMAGRMVVE